MYPLFNTPTIVPNKNNNPDIDLLIRGGFLYFDENNKFVNASSISFPMSSYMIQFGEYSILTKDQRNYLQNRWSKVTLK